MYSVNGDRRSVVKQNDQRYIVVPCSAIGVLVVMPFCCSATHVLHFWISGIKSAAHVESNTKLDEANQSASATYWQKTGSGPLCGVYAATNALAMIGHRTSRDDFVTVK